MGSLLFFFDKTALPARKAFVIGKLKKTTTECDRDEADKTSTIK